MHRLKITLLLALFALIICSCAVKESVSFTSRYSRNAPIEILENQINTSTHTKYGHTILVFDLLNLGNRNYGHSSREGPQVSGIYLYLTSENMDKERFLRLVDMLTQKVIHKAENQQNMIQTLNANSTHKIKDLTILITKLDQRLKIHKVKRHHQLVVTVAKMAAFLKQHTKKLDSTSLKDKLEILQKIENVIDKLPLTKPLSQYRVTDRYRMRAGSFLKKQKMHSGIDLAASKSSEVFASAAGIVKYAGRMNGYGSIVIIDHGKDISTCYAHLQKIAVHKGEYVLLGEKIGIQGNTGRSSGDHLHYEIRLSNKPVNPDIIKRF